jgi:hypothetical protein
MNAGGEALFGGQPAEQGDELLALGGVQAGAELGFVLGRGSHDLTQRAAALAGEVQGADTAVAGDRPPLEEAALLEPVDESHHAARRDLQRLSQRLLRLPFCRGDVSQQHDLTRIEIEARHPLPPEARRMEADLGEQEGGAGYAQALGGRFGIRHSVKHTSVK